MFDKDKVNLVIYPAGNTRTTYTIPDGVKYIHDWAFAGCDYLRAVTFPDSVTDIGYSAFRECRMLRSLINLPDGITKIGRGAFDDTGVWGNTEDGVKYIGKYLIKAECSISGTYKVKEGTKLIADGAFYNCDSLSSIEIADTVTHIGDDAFFSCDALTSVTIPSSVTDIGSNAFYGCKNLTDIYYDGGSEEWEKIDVGSYNTELDSATIHFRYYTVTLDAKNGSFSDGKSLITFNAEPGEVIDFETPILKNYILKGWVDSQGNDIPSPYTMTEGNITLYANWIFDEEGHTHELKTTTVAPTCTESGKEYSVCVLCNKQISETVIPPLNHNSVRTEYTPPTCTSAGIANEYCELCDVFVRSYEYASPLEHTPGEWETVKDSTCYEDGQRIRRCLVCGNIAETEGVESLKHKLKTVTIESTCTVQGMKYDICEICGDVIGDTVVLPLKEHTASEWEVVTPATCTTDGKKIKKCVDCNAPLETEVIGMLGHTPSDEWEVVSQPTVDAEGKRVKRCTVCGEITEEEVISKLEVVRDEDTDVSIVYQPEDYDGEISINVEETFDGGAFSLINTQLNSSEAQIFDITMTVDGVEIQPKGKITVRIPLPEGYNENRSFVYYVNTRTGNVEKMNSRFENGYLVFETDHFSYYAVVDESQTIPSVIEVLIRKPSTTTINYGDSIILHIDIQSELPKNATIIWSAGNGNFDYTVSSDGTTCTITPKSSGDTTFTVTVVDENGNEIGSATQSMTSKAGFFKKFVAFFKKLFGLTKVIPEAFKVIN